MTVSSLPNWLATLNKTNERWKYADLHFLTQHHFVPATSVAETDSLKQLVQAHRIAKADSIVLVCVNGYFIPALSDVAKLPANVIFSNRAEEASTLSPEFNASHYPFANLNAGMTNDGLCLTIPDHCKLNAPIHLLSLVTTSDTVMLSPQHHIVVGRESEIEIIEEHVSLMSQPYWVNMVTTFTLHDAARCTHYKLQREGVAATHFAHTQVEQHETSYFSTTQFSLGAKFARDEIVVQLRGADATCDTAGFYHLREQQFCDYHIDMNHLAPRSQSDMLYKGIMDQRARAVFNGRVYVEKNAQKILAHQANHHLLLSNQAEAFSKPELEIYADDVKCKHGASSGQINQEALFYLRSRGLSYREAQDMLLHAFGDAVFARVATPSIKQHIEEAMYSR